MTPNQKGLPLFRLRVRRKHQVGRVRKKGRSLGPVGTLFGDAEVALVFGFHLLPLGLLCAQPKLGREFPRKLLASSSPPVKPSLSNPIFILSLRLRGRGFLSGGSRRPSARLRAYIPYIPYIPLTSRYIPDVENVVRVSLHVLVLKFKLN